MKSQTEIERVLTYFSLFQYPPSFEEIKKFLSIPMTSSELTQNLREMEKKRKIISSELDVKRYLFSNKSNFFEQYDKRSRLSLIKIASVIKFFRLLSIFTYFEFIGISGSLSMLNGKDNDDIDICIITQAKRMWTARLLALVAAFLLRKKRSYGIKDAKDKLCLNLFFDISDLEIPKHKRNEYVAHEVLQLQPVIDRDGTYDLFLSKNKWVKEFFPNAQTPKTITKRYSLPSPQTNVWGNLFEALFREFQLRRINKKKTTEIITDTQLWFYPEDFEKKIMKKLPDLRSHEV